MGSARAAGLLLFWARWRRRKTRRANDLAHLQSGENSSRSVRPRNRSGDRTRAADWLHALKGRDGDQGRAEHHQHRHDGCARQSAREPDDRPGDFQHQIARSRRASRRRDWRSATTPKPSSVCNARLESARGAARNWRRLLPQSRTVERASESPPARGRAGSRRALALSYARRPLLLAMLRHRRLLLRF